MVTDSIQLTLNHRPWELAALMNHGALPERSGADLAPPGGLAAEVTP